VLRFTEIYPAFLDLFFLGVFLLDMSMGREVAVLVTVYPQGILFFDILLSWWSDVVYYFRAMCLEKKMSVGAVFFSSVRSYVGYIDENSYSAPFLFRRW
jgi:hypothetical protein